MREQSHKPSNMLLQAMKQHRKRISFYRYNDILRQAKNSNNQKDFNFLKGFAHLCVGNKQELQADDSNIGLSSELQLQMTNYSSANYQYHKGTPFVSPANATESQQRQRKYFSCQSPSKSDTLSSNKQITKYCTMVLNSHLYSSNKTNQNNKTKCSSLSSKKLKLSKELLDQKGNSINKNIKTVQSSQSIITKKLGKNKQSKHIKTQ